MAVRSQNRLLDQLEAAKRGVGEVRPAELKKLLSTLGRQTFGDAQSLARFHDALVFLRAFPPNHSVLQRVESLLPSFAQRIARLQAHGADLSALDDEELAGIAGTTLSAILNYDEAAWLAHRFPGTVSIDWDGYDKTERLAAALPRFIPLLREDSSVEPDVPYLRWIHDASGGNDLAWLIRQLGRLPVAPEERAEIFGALELPIVWKPGNSHATRTLGKRAVWQIFYHRGPLLQRRDVALAKELAAPAIPLKKLSRPEGKKIIDLCREATTVRYRELHGTTGGDPTQVLQAKPGRGIEIFLWGLQAERRLPWRAYQAGFTLKNGVPINYFEAISLFEWMEIGFNTFYAYRDGETAWVYAQVLRVLHWVLGVACISAYPYQLGKDNEEAIKSGAFWFYRKLGFRPMRPELARLIAVEEKKILANPAHRTSAATLRKLAQGHAVYEMPGSQIGAWDRFQIRNVGFAVQRRMAEKFRGDSVQMRRASVTAVSRALGIESGRWSSQEKKALEDYAVVLGLILDLAKWTEEEKALLVEIIRAKANSRDASYARLLHGHPRLRAALLAIGSAVKG